MAWGNGRGKRIPEATRRRVLSRDRGICYVCGRAGATEVDHRVPRSQGGTDDTANLAAIHAQPCHHDKTQAEAAAARWRHRTRRPTEPHPGLKR